MNTNLEQLKQIIREAWHTLSLLPDPDSHFRRIFGSGWPFQVVRDPNTEYGATPASWKGVATAHEITVMDEVFVWLLWLRGVDGEYAVKRISWWALQQPIWKIAQREGCSERTITRKIDRSVIKIGVNFRAEIEKIIPMFNAGAQLPPINEREFKPGRIRGFRDFVEEQLVETPAEVQPGRVYIGGEGMRFKGQKYRSTLDYDENTGSKPRR